jgi:predicted DNA-binding transcriptional regulator AlpA
MSKYSALPSTLPPRLLSRAAAAEYVSLSPNTFDRLVEQDLLPQPKCLGRNRLAWDRQELDAKISELPHRALKAAPHSDSWSDIDAA